MDRAELGSLRFSRTETERLLAALVISLCLHLGAWGAYEAGKQLHWWDALHLPTWLHKTVKATPQPPPAAPPEETEPTVFVEVTQPDTEAPKNTKYYSNHNSHAANPDADRNSKQPKLNGHQRDVPKTEDVPRLSKLQPSPEPPHPQSQTAASQAASPMNLGDVKLSQPKPTDHPGQETLAKTEQRPRTLNQARQMLHLPGQQMQLDGGAHRNRLVPSFDAKATAFGDYDRAVIDAVTQRWYDLLDSQQFAQDRTGVVTLKFKLMFDGTIQDISVVQNTVGELLGYVCQDSIEGAAPFGKWPDDMRREIGKNYREITFSFYYY